MRAVLEVAGRGRKEQAGMVGALGLCPGGRGEDILMETLGGQGTPESTGCWGRTVLRSPANPVEVVCNGQALGPVGLKLLASGPWMREPIFLTAFVRGGVRSGRKKVTPPWLLLWPTRGCCVSISVPPAPHSVPCWCLITKDCPLVVVAAFISSHFLLFFFAPPQPRLFLFRN